MKLNKKQKRTATIASMAALLAVVLGMGGQTFAKYISTQETSATATVAKWGFVANAQNDLFGTMYNGAGSITTVASDAVVVSEDQDNLVAPGAKGTLTFSVIGQAEVDAMISINPGAEAWTEVALYEDNANTLTATPYLPMNWTLTYSEKIGDAAANTGTVEDMKNIYTFFNNDAHKALRVEAGTEIEYTYTLSWNWSFYVDDDTDLLDTYLGYMISGTDELPENYNDANNPSVLSSSLSLTVSATQAQ